MDKEREQYCELCEPTQRKDGHGREGGIRALFLCLNIPVTLCGDPGDTICFSPSGAEGQQPGPGNSHTEVLNVCLFFPSFVFGRFLFYWPL